MKEPALAKYVRVDTGAPVVERIWKGVSETRARDRFLHKFGPMLYGGGLCLALLGVFGGARLLSPDEKPRRVHKTAREEPAAPTAVAEPVVTAPLAVSVDAGLPVDGSEPVSIVQGDASARVVIRPDGALHVVGKRGASEVKPEEVTGKVLVRPLGGGVHGAPVQHTLAPKDGWASANIGKLEAPLSEVRYQLQVRGAPIEGTLVVPKGGTTELVEQAELVAKSPVKPGTKGPHGGVVQPVGRDLVELVGKKGSGDLRAYVLDDKLKPKKVGTRKVRLALSQNDTQVVELEPDRSGDFLAGAAPGPVNPKAMTVLVDDGVRADCALVGYLPGAVLVVGPAAPVFFVFVVDTWDVVVVAPPAVVVVAPPPVVVIERHHSKGKKGKGHWR